MVNEPLTKDKEHYIWMGGDCQGLNRVRKAVYIKDDVSSAVRLLREIIEVRKIKNKPKTLFEKECYESWNAAYDNALEDIKQVFGGCANNSDEVQK